MSLLAQTLYSGTLLQGQHVSDQGVNLFFGQLVGIILIHDPGRKALHDMGIWFKDRLSQVFPGRHAFDKATCSGSYASVGGTYQGDTFFKRMAGDTTWGTG